MSHRKGAALLAASALLACSGMVRAAEPQDSLTLANPAYLANTGPADTSLMGVADRLGVGGPLKDYGLTVGGWVELGVSYNFRDTKINTGHVFDVEAQDPTLHQAVVYVDKQIDQKVKQFQWGGHIEMMYGADARFIHANGIFDHYGFGDGPNNQWDPTQFYVDLFLPVGNGLTVRAGKFVTLIGLETINPSGNQFYSHSYQFGFAIPFTHLGVMGTYNLSDTMTVDVGVSRGWEQGFEDNNHDTIDVFGRLSWNIDPKNQTKLAITGIGGPERAGETGDYRYLLDVILSTNISDQLTLALNGDWGYENNAGPTGDAAQWFGVAAYLGYKISDMVSVNVRGEWFDDSDGSRGLGTTVWEATVGLDIHPFHSNPNLSSLRIRPEIRWDYANDALFGADGNKHDQWTAGVDVIFGF